MKRIVNTLVLLVVLFAAVAAPAAESAVTEVVPKLFPQPSFLPEGDDHWIAGSITRSTDGKAEVFRRNYSYFSKNSTRVLDIERKKTFSAVAEIRVFPNFIPAHDFFTAEVAKLDKSRLELAPFGHRAYFSYTKPTKKRPEPVYRMIFRSAVFVITVESADGFALMDVSGGIDRIVNSFIQANAEMFLINRLTLTVEGEGYTPVRDKVTFTDDNVTEVDITGTVFDTAFEPVANAEITLVETGTTTRTDDNGTYRLTVSLSGDKTYAVTRNIYLSPTGETERPLFPPRGLFLIEMTNKNSNASTEASLFITTRGRNIVGTFYPDIDDRSLSYPVTGLMDGSTGSFTIDCSRAYAAFACTRTFAATADENGISGTFDGTGGQGSWSIKPDGYVPVATEHTLSPQDAALRQLLIDTADEVTFPNTRNLEMASRPGEKRYVHVMLDTDRLGIDPVRLKSVHLVLTHLPDEQHATLDTYRYVLSERPYKGRLKVAEAEPVTRITPKDEPFDVSIDITEAATSASPGGILIGPLLDSTRQTRHLFARQDSRYPLIRPKVTVTTYRQPSTDDAPETVDIRLVSEKAEDFAGNRNSAGADGEPDIRLTGTFPSRGTMTYLEITKGGATRRQWNTNPIDIYPVIAVVNDGTVLNRSNGSIEIPLKPNQRSFDLHVYRGSIPRGEPLVMRYRARIDGRWFEGDVIDGE